MVVVWENFTVDATNAILKVSCTGEGNGNPLQYSCLENPVDGGAWWAAVHRVTQSRTQLKRISMHAWVHWRRKWQPTLVFLPGESQGQRSLGGLPSMGLHRVGHDWSDLAAGAAAAFPGCRVNISQWKKWLKCIFCSGQGTHFAGQVIQTVVKTSWASWRLSLFTNVLYCQTKTTEQRNWYMRLNRLLNIIQFSWLFVWHITGF